MFPLPPPVRRAISILNTLGYPCHAVGGCVRDLLLGRRPEDYDLCTAALPDQVWAAFDGFVRYDVGKAHGTVGVLIDGMKLEITTYRTESGYSDGRHPDGVAFVSDLREDLSRRDFTVNAMALSAEGEIVDPFGGREDLEKRLIRCVGEPCVRFGEDSLRVLRALRFAGKLDFAIDQATATAMAEQSGGLCRVARERILTEWRKLLSSERGSLIRALGGRGGIDVMKGAFPALGDALDRSDRDRFAALLDSLCPSPDASIRMAQLLRGLGCTDHVLKGEPLSSNEREEISFFLAHLGDPIPQAGEMARWLYEAGKGEGGIALARRLFGRESGADSQSGADSPIGTDASRALGELDEIEREGICFTVSGRHGLMLDGGDVMRLSGLRGAALGALLHRMLLAVLDREVENTREALTDWVGKQG